MTSVSPINIKYDVPPIYMVQTMSTRGTNVCTDD